jgi:predicted ATPase
MTISKKLKQEFVENLPAEIREGLWTYPRASGQLKELIVDAVLGFDEVLFDDRPEILLNDRPREKGSALRPIGELSPGQRCSAILPILLLNGQTPLIIDQPEDNLDNRLIRQVIINILASIKLRRQVIVATHNPNLPVLGDVEQAIILRAVEEKQSQLESTGDLDSADTVAHLTEIMEGGREAFQYRQSIYQTHWTGPITFNP